MILAKKCTRCKKVYPYVMAKCPYCTNVNITEVFRKKTPKYN